MYSLIFKIAIKNVFLRKSRAILLILMIAISIGITLGLEGLYDSMAEQMVDKIKRSDSGDISLYLNGYKSTKDINHFIKNISEKINSLKKLKKINYIVSRIKVEGLARTARKC